MSRLIGIAGYAQTGKDTVGARLVGVHGFRRVAFADKLKALYRAMDPVIGLDCLGDGEFVRPSDLLPGVGLPKDNSEVRRGLQALGVAARNVLGENVWIDAIHDELLHRKVPTVVTDVRFPNEAERIVMLGGEIWRVFRPGFGPVNGHVSEIAMDTWTYDYVVMNDRSIPDLWRIVDERFA